MIVEWMYWLQTKNVRFVAAYFMTLLTGCVFLGFWRYFQRRWDDDGHICLLYRLLKVILMLFLIPVVYLILWIPHVDFRDMSEWGQWFWYSPMIYKAVRILQLIWLVGFLKNVFKILSESLNFRKNCCLNEPADAQAQRILMQMKEQLRLRRNVKLYRGYLLPTPFIVGCVHPRIYLSQNTEWTEQKLEMALAHELIHCKYHDLFWKRLTCIINCIYWFNPVAKYLLAEVERWTEVHCDYRTGRLLGGYKAYCMFLLDTAMQKTGTGTHSALAFYDNKLKVKERITRMMKYSESCRPHWGTMVCLLTGFVLLSSTTAFAAGMGVAVVHNVIAGYTADGVQEELQEKTPMHLEEFYAESFEDSNQGYDLIVAADEEVQVYATGNINWTFSGKQTKKTSEFYVSADGHITVNVSGEPENRLYDVGIIEPDGSSRWVQNTGEISHTFDITDSGTYQVFVRNVSAGSLYVTGYYKH